MAQPASDAGLTLVEVMIALALFGLISLAGFTFVDSELRVRSRTDGRLERLGDLQRAMYVLTSDLGQMSSGQPVLTSDGLSFRRYAPGGGEMDVHYALTGRSFQRVLGGVADGQPRTQTLALGVTSARWRFYLPEKGWENSWPASDDDPRIRPAAVSIDLALDGEGAGDKGTLRRLVALPAQP